MPDDALLQPLADRLKAALAAQDAAPADVSLQLDCAEAQDALGDALFAEDDLERARFFYWEAFTGRVAVMRERADDPDCEAHFAMSLDKLAMVLMRLGDLEKADELLVEAVERRRGLAAIFGDLANRHLLIVSLLRHSALAARRAEPDRERKLLDEARLALQDLVARYPNETFLQDDLARAGERLRELAVLSP